MRLKDFYYFMVSLYNGVLNTFRVGVIRGADLHDIKTRIYKELETINNKYGVIPHDKMQEYLTMIKNAESLEDVYGALELLWFYISKEMEKEIELGVTGTIDEYVTNHLKEYIDEKMIERAKSILLKDMIHFEGYLFDKATFRVESESRENYDYIVTIPIERIEERVKIKLSEASCTCSYFINKNKPCKHITAVTMLMLIYPEILYLKVTSLYALRKEIYRHYKKSR